MAQCEVRLGVKPGTVWGAVGCCCDVITVNRLRQGGRGPRDVEVGGATRAPAAPPRQLTFAPDGAYCPRLMASRGRMGIGLKYSPYVCAASWVGAGLFGTESGVARATTPSTTLHPARLHVPPPPAPPPCLTLPPDPNRAPSNRQRAATRGRLAGRWRAAASHTGAAQNRPAPGMCEEWGVGSG
jgi:hypothetical protein